MNDLIDDHVLCRMVKYFPMNHALLMNDLIDDHVLCRMVKYFPMNHARFGTSLLMMLKPLKSNPSVNK